jgi:glycosyltransferase involved in cell wall biosynthesis
MTLRPTITGIIATYNEEANIAACLASLEWCDEIIVVDSYSTDRTVAIARQHPKVRLFQREYFGDGSQRNWAINHVITDWFLILDADERCRPELAAEIVRLLQSEPAADAFTIRRRTFVLGKRLRFSGWQNDRVVRLGRRNRARYSHLRVHAALTSRGPAPILEGRLDHFMIQCFHDYLRRVNRYGYWGAAQCWRDLTKPRFSGIVIRPAWRFVRTYLVQLGFLDGMRGLTFCMLQGYATYVKWSLLWSWHTNAARGVQPVLPRFDEDPAVWRGVDDSRSHPARAARRPPTPSVAAARSR